jgi:predicted oxidoreductase
VIQSKAGIRNGFFDFSERHLLEAVDGSLQALKTDYLDVLLLHRPDALVEPEEVASAFDNL